MTKASKTIVLLTLGLAWLPLAAIAAPPIATVPSGGSTDSTGDPVATADDGPVIDPFPLRSFWFSTEIGFSQMNDDGTINHISDGDLLSSRGYIVARNNRLTLRLGIMPVVPDLGLDAVTFTRWHWPTDAADLDQPATDFPRRTLLFSLEENVWSETLGWISHGDLLDVRGRIARTNYQLIDAFEPSAIPFDGVGLDAVHTGGIISPTDPPGVLFSTEIGFFSERLGQHVSDGDLLTEWGTIYRTACELMRNFHPYDPSNPDDPTLTECDFGLDAVYVLRGRVVWFSVEEGFYDRVHGYISDGDILSETGRVIRRNLALVGPFEPLEDAANFGLDALHFWPGNAAVTPDDADPVEP